MKKPLDRVTEAYYDQMGLKFGDKVRKRIHWVCEQAKGEKILDVGCSQGITSILLGRESKQVLGMDLLQESIDYANEMLGNEAEVTKNYVDFKTANFIDYDFEGQKFDSIIFGEVLEHITDPERFIKKAAKLLTDDGRIIVTVPFGINDYFDHKKTYYLKGLLDLQDDQLIIKSVEMFGKWIGVVLVKDNESISNTTFDTLLLNRLEQGFYDIERDLVNQISTLKNQHEKLKKSNNDIEMKLKNTTAELVEVKTTIEKLDNTNSHIEEVNKNLKLSLSKTETENNNRSVELKEQEISIRDLSDKLEKLEKQNELLQKEKVGLDQKIIDLTNEFNNYYRDSSEELSTKNKRIMFLEKKLTELRQKDKKQQADMEKLQKQNKKQVQKQLIRLQQEVLNEKKKKVKSDELLLEAYSKEERLLKTHSQLLKRYEALKTSKLGSLTIGYWKWRKKRFGGKTSGSKSN
ncbi:methyltransferase domain-containing protein [Oceanobacillus sp. FSL W7-1309]|uniref:methyltransferase domain-containing protein n=1 Tax=Oceanobacillus sp. FSL W7-1309 TaxID=2954539 RepID=UPI0030F9A883